MRAGAANASAVSKLNLPKTRRQGCSAGPEYLTITAARQCHSACANALDRNFTQVGFDKRAGGEADVVVGCVRDMVHVGQPFLVPRRAEQLDVAGERLRRQAGGPRQL